MISTLIFWHSRKTCDDGDDDEGNVDVDDDFYQYRGTKWLLANPIVTLSV